MKKTSLFVLCSVITMLSVAQVQMPQASPTQTIIQNFGTGTITLTYSRPSIKGRTLFTETSDLAPLGKMWRTGANGATRLTFTDPVTIGGKNIDTGSYALYTIPGKTEWTIIINRGFNNGGLDGYKESDDVVRFKVPVKQANPSIETFTMQFQNLKAESCDLALRWGNTLVNVPLTVNIKDKIRAQIQSALQGNDKPYWQAANFYYDWDKDYPKALENVNNALKDNSDAFYMYMLKAKIQKALGDKSGAKESAQKCIETATTAKNDDYVKQANDLIKSL